MVFLFFFLGQDNKAQVITTETVVTQVKNGSVETTLLTNIFKNNGVDMKFIPSCPMKIERQCIYHFPRMRYVVY